MSADLHIHSMDGAVKITEEHLRCHFRSSIGHPYFDWSSPNLCITDPTVKDYDCKHADDVMNSDNVWIGEVSWLKAMILEDPDTFIPDPVMKIHTLIGDGTDPPVLTVQLFQDILEALTVENHTSYRVTDDAEDTVRTWLNNHMGHRLFTVSW